MNLRLLLLIAAALFLAPTASYGQNDPRNPAPWDNSGRQLTNPTGAPRALYYWLAATPRQMRADVFEIRASARGRGAMTVRLYSSFGGRTYTSLSAVPPSPTTQGEATGTARASSKRRYLLEIRMDAGIASGWVIVQRTAEPIRVVRPSPRPSPAPTPSPAPPPPGGAIDGTPWPAAGVAEGVPEGHTPVTYVLNVSGGPVTVTIESTTAYSATVTLAVMAPDAAPGAEYALWSPSNFNASPNGNPHRNVTTETRTLAAGRYQIRLTRESASRSSTYAVRITGAVAP